MDSPSRNIEIKAKVRDLVGIISKAKELSGKEAIKLNQKDIFYHSSSPSNRLKLREENGSGTLISYSRPDVEGPKLSKFKKCQVNDPSALSAVLEDALGLKGVVKKQRYLFLVGQTRVHIDEVEGLGSFMELEVMLRDSQSVEEGQKIAQDLMSQLGVSETDLLAGAYMDMLLKHSETASN
uniref:CYTH domain-containing protein n=1 Tax=Graphocephala atropunctata TaxID=36148 RepID=A0A1B6M5A2_9HEMI